MTETKGDAVRHRMSQGLLDWKGATSSGVSSVPDVVGGTEDNPASRADVSNSPDSDAPRLATCHADRLSREQVIDEIIACNPTASAEFLCVFSEDRLRLYLDRLRSSQRSRGRESRWLRTGDSPAIVARERLL